MCVFGAKLRTVMSSIIRWRKGEPLRAVRIGYPNNVELLMGATIAEASPNEPASTPHGMGAVL